MGLCSGLVLTFVVSSLELELDFSQIAAGFLGCWAGSTLLGAIVGVACYLRCGGGGGRRSSNPNPNTLTP